CPVSRMQTCQQLSLLFPYTTLFRSTRFSDALDFPRSDDLRVSWFVHMHRRGKGATASVAAKDGCHAPLKEVSATVLTRMVNCERSEEHTSELQSRVDLVCRLRLETK